MGWISGFSKVTETSGADAFEMTCRHMHGLSVCDLPLLSPLSLLSLPIATFFYLKSI